MPEIRPFRALRYDRASIGDPALVVAPPYDVIGPAEHAAPAGAPSGERRPPGPAGRGAGRRADDRYRRAARTLAAWRSDGTLSQGPASVHLRVRAVLPRAGNGRAADPARLLRASASRGVRTGQSACCPHERTLSGAEGRSLQAASRDRRQHEPGRRACTTTRPATGGRSSTSSRPAPPTSTSSMTTGPPPTVGRRGRWRGRRPRSRRSSRPPRAVPMTIADGHHRYETALRYRDERRMSRSCEEDPAFDYLLTLFLEATGRAAHRAADPSHRARTRRRRRRDPAATGSASCSRSSAPVDADALRDAASRSPGWPRGARAGSACGRATAAVLLTARRAAFEPFLPTGGDALRALDVTLLGVALERLAGIDADAVAGGRGRLHEVGGRGDRGGRRRTRWRRCGVPARADAGRVDLGRRRRRRRHAPEIDVLLSQGPDRPRHQPARMVNRMTDSTPDQILARAQVARRQRPADPQGRDRAPRSRDLHRVVAARAAVPAQAAAVRPWRARRVVALGALPRLFRGPRLGGSRPQPAQPLLVPDGRPDDALIRHLHRGRRRRARPVRLGSGRRRTWHGRPARPEGRRTDADGGTRPPLLRAAARAARAGAPA